MKICWELGQTLWYSGTHIQNYKLDQTVCFSCLNVYKGLTLAIISGGFSTKGYINVCVFASDSACT